MDAKKAREAVQTAVRIRKHVVVLAKIDTEIEQTVCGFGESLSNLLFRELGPSRFAHGDATGLVTKDMYADPLVKKTRDMVHDLDRMMGEVARQMEHLARTLKKK